MKALLFLCLSVSLQANDTGINAGGYGPSPLGEFKGEESVIRMVSETIDIRFGKSESQVVCRFTFRNTKKEGDAKQTVGFPDFIEDGTDHGSIEKLETLVDGKPVESKKVRGWFWADEWSTPKSGLGEPPEDLPRENLKLADFFVVDVSFPPEKDVVIERRYTAGNGGNVEGVTTFYYTTHTGAVWKDTIGKAEFTVKLDGWTVDDLAFEDGPQKNRPRQQLGTFCSPNKTEWTVVSPTELKMTWEDFEPAVHKTRRGILLSTWSEIRE